MDLPFSFNPFHHITSRDSSWEKRNLRLSFGLKVAKIFFSFSGFGLYLNNALQENRKPIIIVTPNYSRLSIGLVNYLTGFILVLTSGIGLALSGSSMVALIQLEEVTKNMSRFLSIPIKFLAYPIFIPFIVAGVALMVATAIVDFTLAAVFTLIALPVLWIQHRKNAQEGEKLRKILTDELETSAAYNEKFIADKNPISKFKCTANDNNLFDYSTDNHKILKIRFTKIDGVAFKVVHIVTVNKQEVSADKLQYSFLLFRDNTEGRAAFDAFVKLNIFNYDEFIATHPLATESASNTTLVVNRTIEQITRPYESLMLDKSGKIEETENIFNYLPFELIEDITTKATSDFIGIKPEEKLSLINHATLKFKGETTTQEEAEKPTNKL